MKVKVNQNACIGCRACAATAESVFELNDEGLSETKKEDIQKEEEKEQVKEAADTCPTEAIEVEE